MTNMSMNDDVPSFYEQLVRYPGQRVLFLTKMSPKEILDFYKFLISQKGQEYEMVAGELEEEEIIVQHFLNGTLTEDMLKPQEPISLEEEREIEATASLVAERQKQRNHPIYRLYRKIVPYENKTKNR